MPRRFVRCLRRMISVKRRRGSKKGKRSRRNRRRQLIGVDGTDTQFRLRGSLILLTITYQIVMRRACFVSKNLLRPDSTVPVTMDRLLLTTSEWLLKYVMLFGGTIQSMESYSVSSLYHISNPFVVACVIKRNIYQ